MKANLITFFVGFKYAFRHQRLISLLEQLKLSMASPELNTSEDTNQGKLKFEPMKLQSVITIYKDYMLYINVPSNLRI